MIKLGDILLNGEPLKKYFDKQTGIEVSELCKSEVSTIKRIIKPRIKEKFNPSYDESPSCCKQWNKKEIIRRNIMEKELPEENSPLEVLIGCMQELKEFTVKQLLIALKVKNNKWVRSNLVYQLNKINKYLTGEFENFPSLISRKQVDGKHEFIYETTDEFNSIPKQNLCAMIEEIKNASKDKIVKVSKKPQVKEKEQSTDNFQELHAEECICKSETNLVELVKVLKPGSIIMQDPNGAVTIIVR